MDNRLATIDMGRKLGGAVLPFWGGELGPHLIQCGLGLGLYLRTKWHLDSPSRLVTTNMVQKLEGAVPPFGRMGAGSRSHLTLSLGLRPTSIPSGILIYPAAWAQ